METGGDSIPAILMKKMMQNWYLKVSGTWRSLFSEEKIRNILLYLIFHFALKFLYFQETCDPPVGGNGWVAWCTGRMDSQAWGQPCIVQCIRNELMSLTYSHLVILWENIHHGDSLFKPFVHFSCLTDISIVWWWSIARSVFHLASQTCVDPYQAGWMCCMVQENTQIPMRSLVYLLPPPGAWAGGTHTHTSHIHTSHTHTLHTQSQLQQYLAWHTHTHTHTSLSSGKLRTC